MADEAPVKLLILGAGGHAKVVADCAALARDASAPGGYKLQGFIDVLDGSRVGEEHFGSRVKGKLSDLPLLKAQGAQAAFPGSGEAEHRIKAAEAAEKVKYKLPVLKHPAATVAASATLGPGTFVAAGAVIAPDAKVGRLSIINTAASVDHDCVLGEAVHVAVGARLAGNVTVGARTLIGAGAVVVPGVKIGADVLVAAGAVVVADVPDGARVMGVPAKARG